MTRRTITLAASTLLSACALFTDLDGFSRPAVADPPDGEATAADAKPDVDPTPSTDDGGSPASLVCTRSHTFCEDFDGADPLGIWERELDVQGTLALVTDRARSAPTALHATLPRRPEENVNRFANIARVWPRSWARVVLEMDVYVEPVAWKDGDINISLASIELDSDGAKRTASLLMNRTSAQVGSSSLGYSDGPPFPTGQWTHVKMDLDPAGKVDGAFDDSPFGAETIAVVAQKDAPFIRITIGLTGYNTPAPAVSAHYDNITVDFDE